MKEYENYIKYKMLGKVPEDIANQFFAQGSSVKIDPVRIPTRKKGEDIRWDEEKKELWVGESYTEITWDMICPYMDEMEHIG